MKRGKYNASTYKLFETITLFAIAMAFLESLFVVYLRNIVHPIGSPIFNLELARETATIIMLACIGILAGRERHEKFAFFAYSFAIWDIFYYIFLKIVLNWPPSLFTWDTLFYIPVKWAGPVIAPVLVSLTLIVFALVIEKAEGTGKKVYLKLSEESLFIGGILVVLFTFLYDYSKIFINGVFSLSGQEILQLMNAYTPTTYNWTVFIIGELLMILGIWMICRRYAKHPK